ncbi:hypothetical protein [Actinomadura decatromicini]|uniref:Cell division protein FtsL n=1 Tax=Actinomadura decatromicini TaxID=2604572 RepID=A0A5D3FHZ2_9ACTN|nr:hypothetical protein [Actinomadura decatromicini]TYK47851.1 hypothetical protein FXF68_19330 [Actinomadura decatromicini]
MTTISTRPAKGKAKRVRRTAAEPAAVRNRAAAGAPTTTPGTTTKPATTKPAKTTTKPAAKTGPKTTTKPATKPAAKRAPATGAARPAAARRAAPRAPFVLLIVGLLGGALVSLLLLNTVLAKDAFTLSRLQQSNKQLEQQRQAYEADIARGGSPEGLSNKAKALGMKQPGGMAFFNPDTGRAGGGTIQPVPREAAAAAGAAGVVGVPGTVVPGDGVPPSVLAGAGTGAP